MARVVHVAVGVIVDNNGNILIAKRSDQAHQGGLWEFPGGKVENGETVFDALKRELNEELGINILVTEPLIKIRHYYGDKIVLLDVHKVIRYNGEPHGNEGQPVRWVAPALLTNYQFPAANVPIVTAINLPQRLLITGDFSDEHDLMARLELALKKGIRLVQLRVKESKTILVLADDVSALCDKYSAKLLLNTSPKIFSRIFPKKNIGLHLNSANLVACGVRPVEKDILLGASCHNQIEIDHAQRIGVDFICLSPVLKTSSHPELAGMSWSKFNNLLENVIVPTYALGGMTEADLPVALEHGAQGIAAISEWWKVA
ncbi:MAG: Nudix family hydrolase [Gammaproteobacteria bacterium]|nr:MAG: Nudix family hydrolase [Gammaproteobacteria bacterium]